MAQTGDQGGNEGELPRPTDAEGRLSVLIELRAGPGTSGSFALSEAPRMELPAVTVDPEYQPIPLRSVGAEALGAAAPVETLVLRGKVASEDELDAIRQHPEVANVHIDTPIAPIAESPERQADHEVLAAGDLDVQAADAMAACPIPPCDCAPGTPKGTIADVATYLGVNDVWAAGFRGTGIVVGVLDGGITAQGRPVKAGQTARRIPRVIGGHLSDWGTEAGQWGEHGNMCATDVLGMAPEAHIYDLRIAGPGGSPGTISRALQAFQWAIDRHRLDGTPQVLTNSWGIFQEAWDSTYARNPNHPFTRKVVEAINEGILVLFAAGNCGDTCPDGRCGSDVGPGRSIWGANGHPLVMTVGAVNRNEQFIGYSSRGPAALDPNKPDFCSISHFTGYHTSDSGTSAATPVLAGVVACLKQARPAATQAQLKNVLKSTAKDIGPAGFDHHSGAGIVHAGRALRVLVSPPVTVRPPCLPTVRPPCHRPTLRPPCLPTVRPPCPRPTLRPPCPRPTVRPPCPRPTLRPPCPRPTLRPPCGVETVRPLCPPETIGPACRPPRTIRCELGAEYGYESYAAGEYGHDPYAAGEYGHDPYAAGEYGYDPYAAGEYGYDPHAEAEHGYGPYTAEEYWYGGGGDPEYGSWWTDPYGGA